MTKAEKEAVLRLYPMGGSAEVRKLHPRLSPLAIRTFARRKGLKAPKGMPRPWREENRPWALPAQDLNEQLACVRLRNWRGPVMAGPLVATIVPEVA